MNKVLKSFNPAPYNYELSISHVENEDAKTIYIKNLIDEDFEKLIYEQVNNKKFEDGIYQPFVGHIAYAINNNDIKNILNLKINKIANENNLLKDQESLTLTECSFAQYTPQYGNKPKLFPHFDTHAKDGQRITVDIQLKSNINWPVIVEGNKFNIFERDAILFYGTQQIHWRDRRENFEINEFTDMLFCHFAFSPQKPWSKNQKEILEYRSHRIRELCGISNAVEEFDIISRGDNI